MVQTSGFRQKFYTTFLGNVCRYKVLTDHCNLAPPLPLVYFRLLVPPLPRLLREESIITSSSSTWTVTPLFI